VALMYVPIAQHVHNFNQRFDAPSQRLTGGSHGTGYIIVAICTVVGAPFFEELFFRGVLLRALARLFGTVGGWVGPTLAIVITGILFGLAHAESLQLLGLATFGVILSFISYRTGRLGMNMVAHASFNLVALAAVVMPMAVGNRVLF
jgi:membrane protease YdiL (CAAX protease family)